MPYVQRDETGAITAVSERPAEGFSEEVPLEEIRAAGWLGMDSESAALDATDLDLIRVLEDLLDLLIDKGVILFTELPPAAQSKVLKRQRLRSALGQRLDLISGD